MSSGNGGATASAIAQAFAAGSGLAVAQAVGQAYAQVGDLVGHSFTTLA